MTLQELIKKSTVIDVRTTEEFMDGHVAVSKNIPLNEIPERLDEFRAIEPPLVLCCLSGGRSGQAVQFLQANGIKCQNAGSWMDVNYALNS